MTRTYKPLGLLTTVVTISIALQAGLDVLNVFATPYLNAPETLVAIEQQHLPTIFLVLFGVLAMLGLFALNAVVFFAWMYRAAANVRTFGRTSLEFTPGAAVVWWFIPFANLIKPYQAMKEVVQASDPKVPVDSEYGSDWVTGVVPQVVGLWWALFIARGVFNVATFSFEDVSFLVAKALFTMVTAGACIMVLRIVSERQATLAAKIDLTSNMGHVPQHVG